MLGWESRAAVRPSRLKRAPTSEFSKPSLKTLTATGRSKTSSLPRKTTDIPPEPISRSSTNFPPRRLTGGLLRNSRLDDLPAHSTCKGLQGLTQAQERLHGEGLLRIAEGFLGLMVRLHDQAICLRGHASFRERNDQVAPSCCVARVHNHRQIREPLGHDHR